MVFIFIGCGKSSKNGNLNESDYAKIEKKFFELRYNYDTTGNKSFLDSAYTLIKNSKYFDKHELDDNNLELFSPIYFNLGKYSELSHLLNESKNLDKFKQEYSLNYINAFSNYKKGNLGSAKNEIKKNIYLLENNLKLNPLDSLCLIDLFKMKLHLESYDSVLEEVDSLRAKSKTFSEAFYNDILIPELKNYKRELPNYISEIPPR